MSKGKVKEEAGSELEDLKKELENQEVTNQMLQEREDLRNTGMFRQEMIRWLARLTVATESLAESNQERNDMLKEENEEEDGDK